MKSSVSADFRVKMGEKHFQICLTRSNKHHDYLNKPSQRQHTAWDHQIIHLITLAVGQRKGFWSQGFTYWASNDHEQHSNTDNSYGCRYAYKNKNVKERRDFSEAPDHNGGIIWRPEDGLGGMEHLGIQLNLPPLWLNPAKGQKMDGWNESGEAS